MSPDCIQLHWLAGPPLDTEWSCYKRREWLVMPMMCVRSASPSAWCVDMGGGFLLSATSQSSRGDKKPSWKLRFDDTHIVHSNSGDLFVYDVVLSRSRGGTKTWTQHINCEQSVGTHIIIIIKSLHITITYMLRRTYITYITSLKTVWNIDFN